MKGYENKHNFWRFFIEIVLNFFLYIVQNIISIIFVLERKQKLDVPYGDCWNHLTAVNIQSSIQSSDCLIQ